MAPRAREASGGASRCAPHFEPLLADHDRAALDAHADPIVGLTRDHRLAYLNAAWDRFAEENGAPAELRRAWDLGASYLAAIAEPLRPFFVRLFERARARARTERPVSCDYECSSGELYRVYHMDVYALGEGAGFLTVHSRVVSRPHDPVARPPHAAEPRRYADAAGYVRQCAHCRRVRRAGRAEHWDWVPAWVETAPADTSHTICPPCLGHFFPDLPRL